MSNNARTLEQYMELRRRFAADNEEIPQKYASRIDYHELLWQLSNLMEEEKRLGMEQNYDPR